MPTTELTLAQVRETVRRLFENARKRKGSPAEHDRFLAYLTHPPARAGRGVRDTFAGRFRYVRFMESVQLEFGICFTNAEWDKGLSLEAFTALVFTKATKPPSRLARERLDAARRRRVSDPLKIAVFATPLLLAMKLSSEWPLRVLLLIPWGLFVGGAIVLALKDVRYAERLVARTTLRAGQHAHAPESGPLGVENVERNRESR